jgi:hypothetical protein
MTFGGSFRKLLLSLVGIQSVLWLIVLLLALQVASALPPSSQISFAFSARSGYAGIQLFDLDYRLPVLIAETSSPIRAGDVPPPAYSWSPDGRQLVYEDRADGIPRLMRMTLPGIPELLAEAPAGCHNPTWSVQDQIAYLCGGTLYLVGGHETADSRREFLPVQGASFDDLLWSADGKRLAHLQLGTIRSLVVRDVTGTELLTRRFEGLTSRIGHMLEWSSENLLLYNTFESWLPYVVEVGSSAFSSPQPLEWRYNAVDRFDHLLRFEWSPDGSQAAYLLYGQPVHLMITDDQLESIRQDIRFYYPSITDVTWSADSRHLYVNRLWDVTRSDITRIDAETGSQTPVTPVFDVRIVNLQWRPGS